MHLSSLLLLVACAAEAPPWADSADDTAAERPLFSPALELPSSERPPNVLVLIADDVGVDKVGAYADDASPDYRAQARYLPRTPTIDALAAGGVRFTDAWANPTCSPTRAALHTGNHAFRTGVGQPCGLDGPGLPEETTSLPEVMAARGYATGLFGKWHLGEGELPEGWAAGERWADHTDTLYDHRPAPVVHGWQTFSGTLEGDLNPGGVGGYTDWTSLYSAPCPRCASGWSARASALTGYATGVTADEAARWISERREGEPWLAMVAFHAAHTPLEPVPEGCAYTDYSGHPGSSIASYQQLVECLDRQIDGLLDRLGGLEDTVVIFLGDNGTTDSLGEAPFDDHRGKGSIYESGVRVPLIISAPGAIPGGRVVSAPVHAVDLFATIAELTGADAADALDSVSLVPLLDGSGAAPRPVFTEKFKDGRGSVAVRSGDWKLIVVLTGDEAGWCRDATHLYNLADDRFETTDRSDDPAQQERLAALLGALDDLAETREGAWFDAPGCQ
jgi:arylsulfatase B